MNDYDIYLKDEDVKGGKSVGFALAWSGLAGVAGFSARPYESWTPWILDPDNPNNPHAGRWGIRQWRLEIAMLDGFVGLKGMPPTDGRTAADMRSDLLSYMPPDKIQLTDVDGSIHDVKMTTYVEHAIEPHDPAHPNGGWLAQVEFSKIEV